MKSPPSDVSADRFGGVTDSDQVPPLHLKTGQNCWSLVAVTLTSIALALPTNASNHVKGLLAGMREGLQLVRYIEKSLNVNADLVKARKVARHVWTDIEIYGRWLQLDLQKKARKGRTSKEILQWLGDEAAKVVIQFKRKKNASLDHSILEFIVASSMYRISHTVLLHCNEKENWPTNEEVFEFISTMIADLLCACFTNLPHVITMTCHEDAIEKREDSIRNAAQVLGKSKKILKILKARQLPKLDIDSMAYIDKWHELPGSQIPNGCSSAMIQPACYSSNESLVVTVLWQVCLLYYYIKLTLHRCHWSCKMGWTSPADAIPWVGLYIFLASLVCTIAMAADVFLGFRQWKLWFPCRFFTINAASITLIAISTKILVDLSINVYDENKREAIYASLFFLVVMLANSLPSLGLMNDNELLLNTVALCILILTIIVNTLIKCINDSYSFEIHVLAIFPMILLIPWPFPAALTVSASRRALEQQYKELHRLASNHQQVTFSRKGLIRYVKKYWMMTETGNPQFTIACSPVSSAFGVICSLYACGSILYLISGGFYETNIENDTSDYKWSINAIKILQSIGTIVGSIAPIFRFLHYKKTAY
ncbi:hypothetical protein LXL04_032450 [Taraxacum kok-saghyz]